LSGVENLHFDKSDPVLSAVVPLCIAVFPYFLLPTSVDDPITASLVLPTFFMTPEGSAFANALLGDERIRKLFHTVSDKEHETLGTVYTSSGHGGSLQLSTMLEIIFQSADALCRIWNDRSLVKFISAVDLLLKVIRKAISGESVTIPGVLLFSGVGVPENIEIDTRIGKICAIPSGILEFIPSSARPVTRDGKLMGCMLVFDVDYEIAIFKRNDIQVGKEWPTHLPNERLNRISTEVALAVALAIGENRLASMQYTCHFFVDPLMIRSMSWRARFSPQPEYVILEDNDVGELVKWVDLVSSVPRDGILVSVRRYLSALNERTDPADSLIDSIIAMESLFGERSEISLAVSSCASRLIGVDEQDRREIFQDVKKLYNLRSEIVHGRRVHRREELLKASARSSRILTDCIRKLYADRSELLSMSSVERAKAILLS
jgi:hypothetical protein